MGVALPIALTPGCQLSGTRFGLPWDLETQLFPTFPGPVLVHGVGRLYLAQGVMPALGVFVPVGVRQ
jgi:hypothetical protein